MLFYVLEFINLHLLAIFVSIQRHLRGWKRNAFRFLTRKLSFHKVVMEAAVVIDRVQFVSSIERMRSDKYRVS